MIVRRAKDIPSEDLGAKFGIKLGKTITWYVHREVGDERYGHNFAMRRIASEPGADTKPTPMHHHEYVEALYIISGRLLVKTPEQEEEAGPGDVVYTYCNEPHSTQPLGDDPLEFICVIDCRGDGANCDPELTTSVIKLDEELPKGNAN
jgi:quercetin dioxygenase-like cupin family protein